MSDKSVSFANLKTFAKTFLSKIQTWVQSQGYTTNIGTITGINMNSVSKGTSGVVDLGTVVIGDREYQLQLSTTAPEDGTSQEIITFVVDIIEDSVE